jgi:Fe2+ transport system protein FeoA
MKNIKVGIDAFNDLAKSHDAHVKEVERLQKELDKLKNLKLVDQNNELLLECRIGDEYHQKLLELGMTKLLEDSLEI